MHIKNSIHLFISTVAMLVTAASHAQLSDVADAQKEGVQIHGYWKLEITNPDGSLDRVVEFENEFVGAEVLTGILAGNRTVSAWGIKAGADTDQLCDQPDVFGGGVGPCFYLDLPPDQSNPDFVGSLTVEALNQAIGVQGGVKLILLTMEGSTTVDHAGNIHSLETLLFTCGSDVSPDECATNPLGLGLAGGSGGLSLTTGGTEQSTFTRKVLDAPEPVTAGQSVTVNVTIRFH